MDTLIPFDYGTLRVVFSASDLPLFRPTRWGDAALRCGAGAGTRVPAPASFPLMPRTTLECSR